MRSIAIVAFAVSAVFAGTVAAQSGSYPNPYPVYPPQGGGYGTPGAYGQGGGVNQGMYGQGGGVGPGMYGNGGGFGQGMYGQGMYGQGMYGQGMYGQGGMYGQDPNGERPKARGLFALTLAGLLAQGVGGGLSQGLGGSIVKWFSGEPKQGQGHANQVAPQAMAPQGQGFAAQAAAPQAGLAFEVHLVAPGSMPTPVDPSRHMFRTGDRFVVHYRPTLPGRVQVFNTNGQGVSAQIDSTTVAAGQLTTLGPYEFVDTPGDETLRITLEPCSTPELMAATRGIVRVGASEGQMQLADCGGERVAGMRTRGITKVAMEGTTGFALDPVSRGELASGNLATREVAIRLQHR